MICKEGEEGGKDVYFSTRRADRRSLTPQIAPLAPQDFLVFAGAVRTGQVKALLLAGFFHKKGRSAGGAGLGDGLVPGGEIAVRVAVAAVENLSQIGRASCRERV